MSSAVYVGGYGLSVTVGNLDMFKESSELCAECRKGIVVPLAVQLTMNVWGMKAKLCLFMALTLVGGKWSVSHLGYFNPQHPFYVSFCYLN